MDAGQKVKSLRVISEHFIAVRWKDVRGPSDKELKATTVLEFSIEEASSKVRTGPPVDDESDYGLPVWAGVLPLEVKSRHAIPDDKLIEGVAFPDYLRYFDACLNRGSVSPPMVSQSPQAYSPSKSLIFPHGFGPKFVDAFIELLSSSMSRSRRGAKPPSGMKE